MIKSISKNNLEVLKLLIENGANVNLIDGSKGTPLIRAIDCNKIEMVEILIENGADINMVDTKLWTLLQRAISSSNSDILQLLIEHKVNDSYKISKNYQSTAHINTLLSWLAYTFMIFWLRACLH